MITSDDFAGGILGSAWRIEGPGGISVAVGSDSTDAYLELVTPDGNYDVWQANNGARALQSIADTDFDLETRFLTVPTEKYQLQGFLIEQDADNWLRFDTYSDGKNLRAFAATTVNGVSSAEFNVVIPGGVAPYLRVARDGDVWTFEHSADGQNWNSAGSFSHAITATSAGLFAGNVGGATGYTARADYFETATDPIVGEDSNLIVTNVAPVAQDDAFIGDQDAALTIDIADLLANDTDANGDALTLVSFTQPASGTLADNGNGTLTYTPNAGFAGGDTFSYTTSDGALTDNADVAITINATPQPGVDAVSDDFSGVALDTIWRIEGPSGIAGGVGADAVDAYLELVTPDGNFDAWGTNNGARALQSIADTDFDLETRFLTVPTEKYQLQGFLIEQDADNWLRFDTYSDGKNLRAFAATTVNGVSSAEFNVVIPGGVAPYLRVARDGDVWTFEHSADGQNWNSAGSFSHAITATSAGLFAGNVGGATGYTARADYFETATDPIVGEDSNLIVTNVAPVAQDDAFIGDQDAALTIDIADLLANDTDANGDALTLVSFTQPASGTLADNGNGTLTYTPNAGFAGGDTFSYTTSDGALTDNADVAITINATPQPGVDAVSDDFSGVALDTIWRIEGPSGIAGGVGADAVDAYLELVTPDGNFDAWGTNNGARALQSIADTDFDLETRFLTVPTEKYQLQGFLIEQDADNWLRFDTYSDGKNLRAFAATTVNGVSSAEFNVVIPGGVAPYLRVARDGDVWTFEHSADGQNWNSAGSFSHAITATSAGLFAGNVGGATGYTARADYFETATDPIVGEDSNLIVTNVAPVAQDDAFIGDQDAALTIDIADLLANDTDANGDALTLVSFTQPASGTLADNGNGTLTYTPNAGFAGGDTFSYTTSDGALTDNADVAITINATPVGASAISDDFAGGSLDPVWQFEGIAGFAQVATNATDGFVEIHSPFGAEVSASDVLTTPRLLQAVVDEDFEISAGFLSEPGVQFSEHGLLVIQDSGNWLRFDVAYTGSHLDLIVGVIENGVTTYPVFDTIQSGEVTDLRVSRTGDVFTFESSNDGTNWATVHTLNRAMDVTHVGLFGGSTSFVGEAPGYIAQVDYFENSASPIVNEDGTIVPANVPPRATDDDYGTAPGQALVISIADLLSNDADSNDDVLSIASFTQPGNGSLVDNGNGTLTYTPNGGFTGADTFTYAASDGTLVDTATVNITVAGIAMPAQSDDFADASLDAFWRIEGPSGISGGVGTSATDAFLELVTPDGNFDVFNSNNGARALQSVANTDFELETRFLTTPTDKFQFQGFLIEEDANNWLRFDTYSDGNKLIAFAAVTVNGVSSPQFNVIIPGGQAPYLRLDRDGSTWTFEYSQDGQNWTTAGSFAHSMTVASAGLFAGNTGDATGYTARADYFENLADPIVDEDGAFVPVNVAPDAADDFISTRTDTAIIIDVDADLLANDSDPNLDAVSFVSFTQPGNGALVDNGDGTLTFTPASGFEGDTTFSYTISDGALTDTAIVTLDVGDLIDVWYGDTQTFGIPGESQEWINILGNVAGDVTGLSYTLNGGADRVLSLGPDTRRLQENGDFNIDISYDELDGSAVDDLITITANFSDGSTETTDVTVEYEDGLTWPANYSIDWSTVSDLQSVVQVVDGTWEVTNDGVRPVDLGYDRLLVLGDETWDNYELNTTITPHDLTNVDPLGRDGGAFIFGMLWGGHTEQPIAGFQPRSGYEPGAAFHYTQNEEFSSHSYHSFTQVFDREDYDLNEETTYNVTVRVEQVGIYDRLYSLKIWEEGTAEPTGWTIQGQETFSLQEAPATGSLYLAAHYFDVTFGDLQVTEITGQDIVQGTDGDDVQIAVNGGDALPGVGEIDVFVGNGGADTFVFGDTAGSFYDDGNNTTSGVEDYGFIYDFARNSDEIELHGSASDYTLVEDVAGLTGGTSIWLLGQSGDQDELIGVVNDVYDLDLSEASFVFVGDAVA